MKILILISKSSWANNYKKEIKTHFKNFTSNIKILHDHKDIKNNYISRSGYVDLNRNNLKEVINIGSKPLFELGLPGSFDEFGSMTSCFLDVGDNSLIGLGLGVFLLEILIHFTLHTSLIIK